MALSTTNIDDLFTTNEEGIKKFLPRILNLSIQHEATEKTVISSINKLLSSLKNRKDGLEYLNLIIHNCNSSILNENALNWVNHCIIKFPEDNLRELKLRLVGGIIEAAHKMSDFNKKFISDFISAVFDNCITTLNVNPYECRSALKTLVKLMKYYPGWIGVHKQKIENFVLIFLEYDNQELVQDAGFAFHYLQQIGSAGTGGINHKTNFSFNFHKLCKTVHSLYNKFYEDHTDLSKENSEQEIFIFKLNPLDNFPNMLYTTAKRIENVFKFIEIMIKTAFSAPKETKPKELFDIISEVTSLHECITDELKVYSLETVELSMLIQKIQCAALKLLRLCIIWYQIDCLPFSYIISKIIVDSIERIQNCGCYKADRLYQESAYKALSQWIRLSKSSLHAEFQNRLFKSILIEITPEKTHVTLTISESAAEKQSQKAKRRAMTNRIISSGKDTNLSELGKDNLCCYFALSALKDILECITLNVKPNILKDLYKTIFDSLLNMQSGKSSLVPLFNDIENQVKIYEVLVAFYYQKNLSILPPLHTTLNILSNGVNEKNRFITQVCENGIRIIESFCQPICPSLYMGIEQVESDQVESLEKENIEVMDTEEENPVEELQNNDAEEVENCNSKETLGNHNETFEINNVSCISSSSENLNELQKDLKLSEDTSLKPTISGSQEIVELSDSEENLDLELELDDSVFEKDNNSEASSELHNKSIEENASSENTNNASEVESKKRGLEDSSLENEVKKPRIEEKLSNDELVSVNTEELDLEEILNDDSFVDEVKTY